MRVSTGTIHRSAAPRSNRIDEMRTKSKRRFTDTQFGVQTCPFTHTATEINETSGHSWKISDKQQFESLSVENTQTVLWRLQTAGHELQAVNKHTNAKKIGWLCDFEVRNRRDTACSHARTCFIASNCIFSIKNCVAAEIFNIFYDLVAVARALHAAASRDGRQRVTRLVICKLTV